MQSIIIKIDYQCHLDYAYTYIIKEKPKRGFNYRKPDCSISRSRIRADKYFYISRDTNKGVQGRYVFTDIQRIINDLKYNFLRGICIKNLAIVVGLRLVTLNNLTIVFSCQIICWKFRKL